MRRRPAPHLCVGSALLALSAIDCAQPWDSTATQRSASTADGGSGSCPHVDYGNVPDPGPHAGIPAQTVTPGILLPGGSLACDPTTNDPCVQTGLQAMAILEQDCSNCHGEQAGVASGAPQWNFVLNIDEMETSTIDTAINPNTKQPWRFLIAGDPDNSRIYARIAAGAMPPGDQKHPRFWCQMRQHTPIWPYSNDPSSPRQS